MYSATRIGSWLSLQSAALASKPVKLSAFDVYLLLLFLSSEIKGDQNRQL
jgi:hypothetical protein